MRLEDLTIENINSISDKDLKNLKNRAEQLYSSTRLWKVHLKKNQMGLKDPIDKGIFMKSCSLLYKELHKRRLITEKSVLDAKLIKKAVKGIDTQDLPILTVKKNVAYITGKFVDNPQRAENVTLVVDDTFPSEIVEKIVEIVQKETEKTPQICKSFGKNTIPLYDLVLLPKQDTNIIESPEIKEDTGISITFVKGNKQEKETRFCKNEEQRLVGGIIYEIGVIDADGDTILETADIWKCLKSFALNDSPIHFMHNGERQDATVIESFQAEEDTAKGGDIIPAGAWYMTAYIEDDELWAACKDGSVGGFSMAGQAKMEVIVE